MIASLQAAAPWALAQCDAFMGMPAQAVFNTITWNAQGWPLWRIVCWY